MKNMRMSNGKSLDSLWLQ